jgi:hypothetical protein
LRDILGKKISKASVNDGFTDRVLGLRDFETLRGSIVKIETSVAELKIVVNFRGVIRTFPKYDYGSHNVKKLYNLML